jgi:transposase
MKTSTFLGERLRRLSRRLGGNRAWCAVGRSILVIIWHLLSDPPPGSPTSAPAGTTPTPTATKIRAHLRQLQALGLDVTITPTAA